MLRVRISLSYFYVKVPFFEMMTEDEYFICSISKIKIDNLLLFKLFPSQVLTDHEIKSRADPGLQGLQSPFWLEQFESFNFQIR